MKQIRVLLVLAILASAVVSEASFYAIQQLTVDNTAGGVGLSTTILTARTTLTYVQCRLRTAEISFLFVDPRVTAVTTTVGVLLQVGDVITIRNREDMLNFRAIRTTGTSGQLDCIYKGPT